MTMETDDISEGLSFDDVLLQPKRSDVLPADVNLETQFTPELSLNVPMVSAAMDTVTEDRLAIALAREGGIGVIHRNCTIQEQCDMVENVKRSENTIIDQPITVPPSASIQEAERLMDERGVSGIPVVDDSDKLLGMVTRRDKRFVSSEDQTVTEIMTPRQNLVTSSPDTELEEARSILHEHKIEKLPLVDDEGILKGLMTGKDIEKRIKFQNAVHDESGQLIVAAAIGVGDGYMERSEALVTAGVDCIVLDAATGHTSRVIDVTERLSGYFEDLPIVSGNVATKEGAHDLIDAGAAAVKTGVGPGSICTTRVVSGVGVPQFTAIKETAAVCRERGVPMIADGGIRYSGDIVKALAGGADTVMTGSLLAGTEESPGRTVNHKGRTFKEYRGMGSERAMEDGSKDRYGQNASEKVTPEGVESRVPYQGPLSDKVFHLMGGVRSGMGYVGAENLKELRENAEFLRITSGGLRESHAHDVELTEEPVNYSPPS